MQRALTGTLEREKWVAFSLDDGFAEQVTLAGNIFAKFNCPSTCFLLTGFIDGPNLAVGNIKINYLLSQTGNEKIKVTTPLGGRAWSFNLPETPKAHQPIIAAIRKLAPSTPYDSVSNIASSLQIRLSPQRHPLERATRDMG